MKDCINRQLAKLSIVIVMAISPIGFLYAQTDLGGEHPIDQRISACKTDNPTTLGLIECDLKGYEEWTEEMERLYDLLMRQLSPKEQENLKAQQIAWLKMRDLQLEFNNEFYKGRGHTGLLMIASSKTDFSRRRAMDFQTYLDILNMK